jgi:valyl-tRNA synthetase
MLEKTYTPKEFETALYEKTEGTFGCDVASTKTPYTIMMPPPNVTGSLHLGHALTYTLQDILIRFKRLCEFDVLWQPGTDHAGIATQMVVERQLASQGMSRQELGRAEFLKKVWAWKEESGNTIVHQQRRLGISPDWNRSRFTMDDGLSKAVNKVFVSLHQQGLIYRAKRLVNWDTHFKTAISDVEVVNQEVKGNFYHIFYPFEGSKTEGITIATTRPETLFGDVAVAVHPEDERYMSYLGKRVQLPLMNRLLPIIGDTYCDPEKGTGAVKITPGHDFNDFAIGERHHLTPINILTPEGLLNDAVPSEFQGLTVQEARKKVVAALEEQGLLVKVDPYMHLVPFTERSNVEVQPYLTDQWFVDAKVLAEPALKAVEDGQTKFVPEQWTATYYEWLRNIQPWCISRQIWWGHQIPAWYGPDNTIFVAETEDEAQKQAEKHFGKPVDLKRDDDVLDTWFSSALWPFSTLGWPDETAELKRYYPTDVLITGFDIIFFWVARMMMMGIHFTSEVPFKTVYMHALVRDEKGQKMSKSKGNIIDPLYLMDKYGADALRFTLASLAAPGRDVKLGESRVEGYRNFMTKLWNAARFLEMNECRFDAGFKPEAVQHPLNQWMVAETVKLSKTVYDLLEAYRFDLAAQTIYQYLWGTFCDIYVECLKPQLADNAIKVETQQTAAWALVTFLKVTHPFMPLVTEKLWGEFYPVASVPLATSAWPKFLWNPKDTSGVETCLQLVHEARSIRGLLGVPPSLRVPVSVSGDSQLFETHQNWMAHLGRFGETVTSPSDKENGIIPVVVGHITLNLHLGDVIDMQEALKLLNQKAQNLAKEIDHLAKKLQNEAYKNAKPEQWADDEMLYKQKQQEYEKMRTLI